MNSKAALHTGFALGWLAFISAASGQSTTFTYQGRLDSAGAAFTGNAEFQVTLWDAASGGAQVAANNPTTVSVSVTNGLFVLPLDFGTNLPGADRWLQFEVRTSIGPFSSLSPRQRLAPAPYAITADNLSGTLPSGALVGTYASAVNLSNAANNFSGNGAGLTSLNASQLTSGAVPAGALSNAWKVGGNAGTTPAAHFLGTTDGQPLELRAAGVGIGTNNPNAALHVSGAESNGTNATVKIFSNTQTLMLDGNEIDSTAALHLNFNRSNDVSLAYGGGGVGIGTFNPAAKLHVVGDDNDGTNATLKITSTSGTQTLLLDGNEIDSTASLHLNFNSPNNVSLAFGGGSVGIGIFNPQAPLDVNGAVRINSVGDGAVALNLGIERSWAFRQLGSGSSTALELASVGGGGNKNFVINTTGFVGIGTNAPQAVLHVVPASFLTEWLVLGELNSVNSAINHNSIRARFNGSPQTLWLNPDGGNVVIGVGQSSQANRLRVVNATCDGNSWINASDRNLKENFEPVDPQNVLARLTALPIHRWSYTNSPNTRHLGPTAQDFHAAFGLGDGDTAITTVDADGVALAAIQGLNRKFTEELKRRDAENAELKRQLDEIKTTLRYLAEQKRAEP